MKRISVRTPALVLAAVAALSLTACSSDKVIDNTVGVAAGATKLVAKGTVGAGKMVYRGITGEEKK